MAVTSSHTSMSALTEDSHSLAELPMSYLHYLYNPESPSISKLEPIDCISMETKLTIQNPSSKRDGRRLSRCPRLRMPRITAPMETFTCHGDESRVVRVKVVLSKHEARQFVASIARARSKEINQKMMMPMPKALEQLLHVLRRRHTKRAEDGKDH